MSSSKPDQAPEERRRPAEDDRFLSDIFFANVRYAALLVSHRLGLYRFLAEGRTLPEIGEAFSISPRAGEALLVANLALGLVSREEGGRYALTERAEDYLLETSPTYFGWALDLVMEPEMHLSTTTRVYNAVRASRSVPEESTLWTKPLEESQKLARLVALGMHSHSAAPAQVWPDVLDLSGHRLMLDIGGGAGTHAIGALSRWPHLRGTVLDFASICTVTREFIARHGLEGRLSAVAGDMWTDPFPPADLHFYADVFHNWGPSQNRLLAQKSFQSLPPGGRIVVHELLLNEDKTGPALAAAYNISMVIETAGGRQYSGRELADLLAEVGFSEIEVKQTFGDWSIVTGRKPEFAHSWNRKLE